MGSCKLTDIVSTVVGCDAHLAWQWGWKVIALSIDFFLKVGMETHPCNPS